MYKVSGVEFESKDIDYTAWDLNFFNEENDGIWEQEYTCQPSLYISLLDNKSMRVYLKSFKISKDLTETIEDEYCSDEDFFVDADHLLSVLPSDKIQELIDRLNELPYPEEVLENPDLWDSNITINLAS